LDFQSAGLGPVAGLNLVKLLKPGNCRPWLADNLLANILGSQHTS